MCLSPDVSSLCSPAVFQASLSSAEMTDWHIPSCLPCRSLPFSAALEMHGLLQPAPTHRWNGLRTPNFQNAESGFIACHSFWDFLGAFMNIPCLKKTGHEGIAAFCDCPLPRPPERHIHLWLQVCCVCIVNHDMWIDRELVNPFTLLWKQVSFSCLHIALEWCN